MRQTTSILILTLLLLTPPAARATIVVGLAGGPNVEGYADNATGDAAPEREWTTSGAGDQIAVDAVHRELFVSGASLWVFDLDAPAGPFAPLRTLRGAGIDGPRGIALETARDELFVANFNGDSIAVFRRTAEGSAPPLRALTGPMTGLDGPYGVALDTVHNEIFVSMPVANVIRVFRLTDTGNVAPLRTLSGGATLLNGPRGLAVDLANDELVVVLSSGAVHVYPRGASGDVAPTRRIAGSSTGLFSPSGVALNPSNDYIVTSANNRVVTFARTASGDVAPLRTIAGPNTKLSLPSGVAYLPKALCQPGPTTLCIDDEPGDGRFRIEVQYRTAQSGGLAGPGRAIPLAPLGVSQGGVFWFFSPGNPEMLIKVLNACSLNQRFWIFYSAGTNVGLTTTVTDLKKRRTWTRTNPDLTPAPPVQDTGALPCN